MTQPFYPGAPLTGDSSPAAVAGDVAARARADAGMARTAFDARVTAARNDLGLSDQGRADVIVRAWLSLRDQLQALQARELDAVAGAQSDLEAAIFRPAPPSTDPVVRMAWDASIRDSQARYDALQGPDAQEAALRLWRRAERTGDEPMARAALVVSLERGWATVRQAYAEAHPEIADVLGQLASISDTLKKASFRFGRSTAYSMPPRPLEIQNMSDWQIDSMYGGNGVL